MKTEYLNESNKLLPYIYRYTSNTKLPDLLGRGDFAWGLPWRVGEPELSGLDCWWSRTAEHPPDPRPPPGGWGGGGGAPLIKDYLSLPR